MTRTLPDNLPLAGHWLVPCETFADKENRRVTEYFDSKFEAILAARYKATGECERLQGACWRFARRSLPRPLYTRTGRPM